MTVQQPTTPPSPSVPAYQGFGTPGQTAVYQGLRAQRRELTNQLEELEDTRDEITNNLMHTPMVSPQREVLETRLTEINKQISVVDGMLASNSASLAQAAAVPGAVVQPARIIRQGPPEEAYVLGGMFMVIVLLPLSVALARRVWRRSVTAVTTFPRELGDRLSRMEHALEATSIEVERIGEGQRFLTRLFTEGESARALSGGAGDTAARGSHLLERKQGTPERLP